MSENTMISFQADAETVTKLTRIIGFEERNRSDVLRRLISEKYDALFVSIPKVELPTTGKIVYPQKQE